MLMWSHLGLVFERFFHVAALWFGVVVLLFGILLHRVGIVFCKCFSVSHAVFYMLWLNHLMLYVGFGCACWRVDGLNWHFDGGNCTTNTLLFAQCHNFFGCAWHVFCQLDFICWLNRLLNNRYVFVCFGLCFHAFLFRLGGISRMGNNALLLP